MVRLPVAVEAAAASDTGRVREQNEDAVWLGDEFFRTGIRTARYDGDLVNGLLLAVADGVGGAAAGEVASQFVAERMAAAIRELDPAPDRSDLRSELQRLSGRVNDELTHEARRGTGRSGMATTYTGLYFSESACVWLNAGDSRLYALRDGRLRQVTRDHTLREEMNDPSIPGNIITNCYGHQDGFRMDTGVLDPQAADLYLLCSDGLSDYADMDRVTEVLAGVGRGERAASLRRAPSDGEAGAAAEAAPNPDSESTRDLEQAARALVELALTGGGGDNVTIVIARPVYE
jgi:protein phosphatase